MARPTRLPIVALAVLLLGCSETIPPGDDDPALAIAENVATPGTFTPVQAPTRISSRAERMRAHFAAIHSEGLQSVLGITDEGELIDEMTGASVGAPLSGNGDATRHPGRDVHASSVGGPDGPA